MLKISMGVNQVARVSEAISEKVARGLNNTAKTRGKSKRRTVFDDVVVAIGVNYRSGF
jgi:hypothetical protein